MKLQTVISYLSWAAFGALPVLRRCLTVGFLISGMAAPLFAAQNEWLITPDEAALAPAPEEESIRSRGLTDAGPRIDIVKPVDDVPQASPFEIQIRFYPRAAAVKPESVKVQLVKFISIDITDRVKPYLSGSGLEVKEAKIPSGTHRVRISVSDEQGATSSREMELEVK